MAAKAAAPGFFRLPATALRYAACSAAKLAMPANRSLDAGNPSRYPEVTCEQYRLWFLRNNYHAAADAPVEMAKP